MNADMAALLGAVATTTLLLLLGVAMPYARDALRERHQRRQAIEHERQLAARRGPVRRPYSTIPPGTDREPLQLRNDRYLQARRRRLGRRPASISPYRRTV